jgi:caffeoyl-CoA O-methyltransferase
MINPEIENYCIAQSSPLQSVLDELERFTYLKVQMPHMISGKLQGQILSMISTIKQPRVILEVGTFTGYATICLHSGLQESGKLYTIDINSELEEDVKSFFEKANVSRGTEYIIGNAISVIPKINDSFDLVFLDADKKKYIDYLNILIPKMNSGALLITDNVLWKGKVAAAIMDSDTLAIHNFNIAVLNHPELEVVILPIRDGISIARKK